MFVVIGHGTFLLTPRMSKLSNIIFDYEGVSIFFVLSGFLIGGILIKTLEKREGERNVLLNFWIRRWFRTIPPYFLILILLLILNLILTKGFSFNKEFPLNFFTFTQNLFYRHPKFFPEAWSLSIEEWFYFLIPPIILFFIFLKRSVKMSFLYTALCILVAVTLFRLYRYTNLSIGSYNQWDLLFRKQVITRLDSLMYGMIGAFFQYYYRDYWLKYKKTLLCFGLLLFLTTKYLVSPEGWFITVEYGSLYSCVLSFSVTSFATLLLLPFLSDIRRTNIGIINKSITKISLISYSMYLINLSLIQFMILSRINFEAFISNTYIMIGTKYLLYWFLTISLSMILYKYFEVPMMNLRDNKKLKKWLRI
jgi:peptidoglycan/LPS O-acetylase OafA/YrhL